MASFFHKKNRLFFLFTYHFKIQLKFEAVLHFHYYTQPLIQNILKLQTDSWLLEYLKIHKTLFFSGEQIISTMIGKEFLI